MMAIDRAKLTKQAEGHLSSRRPAKAIGIFLQLLDDSPKDFSLANKIGDIYLQVNEQREAVAMFKRAAIGFEGEGFLNKAIAILKKALRACPEDTDIAVRLADLYKRTKMTRDAIQMHIQLADTFTNRGDSQRASKELAKAAALDSQNVTNKVRLAELFAKEGMEEQAAKVFLELGADASDTEATPPPDLMKHDKLAAKTLPSELASQVRLLTNEAEMHEGKARLDKAIESYQGILDIDPTNSNAIERIAEIHKAAGMVTKSHSHLCKAAEKIASLGERELAVYYLDMAEALISGSTRAYKSSLGLTGVSPAAPPPVLEETQPPIETEAAAGQEVDFSAIAHQESDTAQPYFDTGGLNEPSELDRTTTPIAPPPPSQEQEEAKEQMAQTEQPRPGEGFEKADLVQVLNSIDFQLDFGNPIEAKMEIERALLIFQDSQELMNRLEITEERLKMCQPTVSAAEPNEKDFASSIDLPKMLDSRLNPAKSAEELNDDIKVADRLQTAEELFNAFRDEVAAKVDGNDYDTHYDLGIAYKEMMLPDPAIEEFKKAMANPERTIECCSMLALCERMKGDLKAATNWLLIGIVAPGFPPIDSRGLRLDLAALLKEMGSHGESEALFQEIKDLDNALGIDWA